MTANYMLKKQETGRSMIEMLGVLAIIGVLSVGGIAGYTSAMNKHRANELLHQVSMRANVCRAQLVSGNTNLSVDDFGAYDGYTFTPSYDATNKKYSITVTAPTGKTISKVVCNNMKNALPSTVEMTTPATCADNNTITLTYVDDVSSSSAEPVVTCTPACQTGEECVDGICMNMDDSYDCGDGSGCLMKTGNTYTCLNDANDEGYYADITNNNRCALISDCVNSGGCLNFVDDYSRKVCGAECIHHQVVKGYQGDPDKYDIENNYYASLSGYNNSPKGICQPIKACHIEAWKLLYNSGSYSCWECSDDGCSCIVGNTYYPDYNNGGQCASVEACTSSGGTLDDPDADIYTCVH